MLNTSTLYSTCLEVPTTIEIAASRTWVASGGSVTFTATLRSAGTGKLSNNLVSGRTVVLQRRTSSGWTDVATMAPGSSNGSYAVALTMRATWEVRAVFRRPSNEALGEVIDLDLLAVVRRPRGREGGAHEREWRGEDESFHRKHGRRYHRTFGESGSFAPFVEPARKPGVGCHLPPSPS